MQRLKKLNDVSKFVFGELTVENPSYLKFDDENKVYVPMTSNCRGDLMTLQSIGENVILNLENDVVELVSDVTYFLKPIPESIGFWQAKLNVRLFKLVENVGSNAQPNNQLAQKKDFFAEMLKSHIGSKKLKMSCWPFPNISLQRFLNTCDIPHRIIVIFMKQFYVFDSRTKIKTSGLGSFYPQKFFSQAKDITVNGTLFCDCKFRLKKKITNHFQHHFKTRNPGNLTVIRKTFEEEKIEEKFAFIIFNHDLQTNGKKEKVLRDKGARECDDYIF